METLSPRKESMPKIDLHLVGTDTKKKLCLVLQHSTLPAMVENV